MRLYEIDQNGDAISLEEFIEKYFSDSEDFEDDDVFRDNLDETYGSFEIYGENFSAAEILENCSETSYYNCRSEWAQEQMEEYIYEAKTCLPQLKEHEHVWIYDYCVTFVKEEEESDNKIEELI